MDCFLIHCNRHARFVEGAVPGETAADKFAGLGVGDEVVEFQLNPLKLYGPGVYPYEVIVVEGLVKGDPQVYDGIYESAVFNFSVGVRNVAHEGRSAELEIAQVIGMVHHLGAVGVGVKGPVLAPVPYLAAGLVQHKVAVSAVLFRNKGLWFHATSP